MIDTDAAPGRIWAASVTDDDPAYTEGARDFARGALVSACPYPAASSQRDAWESGWFDFAHAVEMLPDG